MVKAEKQVSPKRLSDATESNLNQSCHVVEEEHTGSGEPSFLNETFNTDSRSSRCTILWTSTESLVFLCRKTLGADLCNYETFELLCKLKRLTDCHLKLCFLWCLFLSIIFTFLKFVYNVLLFCFVSKCMTIVLKGLKGSVFLFVFFSKLI